MVGNSQSKFTVKILTFIPRNSKEKIPKAISQGWGREVKLIRCIYFKSWKKVSVSQFFMTTFANPGIFHQVNGGRLRLSPASTSINNSLHLLNTSPNAKALPLFYLNATTL